GLGAAGGGRTGGGRSSRRGRRDADAGAGFRCEHQRKIRGKSGRAAEAAQAKGQGDALVFGPPGISGRTGARPERCGPGTNDDRGPCPPHRPRESGSSGCRSVRASFAQQTPKGEERQAFHKQPPRIERERQTLTTTGITTKYTNHTKEFDRGSRGYA